MDYNEFAQRIKNKYPEYKDMDNKELSEKIIAKYPEYKSQVTFENIDSALKENKGIDITPSGLAKKAGVAISTPIRQLRYGESKDEARANAKALIDNAFKNNISVQGLGLATDIAPYFTMPQLNAVKGTGLGAKAINSAFTGLYQGGIAGGLESLKQKGDLSGISSGAEWGAATGFALPVAWEKIKTPIKNVLNNPQFREKTANVIEAITSVPSEYTKRALDKELLGQTIFKGKFNPKTAYQGIEKKLVEAKGKLPSKEYYKGQYKKLGDEVRKKLNANIKDESYFDTKYNELGQKALDSIENLKNQAGDKVSQALSELPEDVAFYSDDLIKDVNNIYGKYSLSNNPTLNVANNQAKNEYKKIKNLIDGEQPKVEIEEELLPQVISNKTVSPKELYDINRNVSAMTQWNNPNAGVANDVLEQIYGSFSGRLNALSPDLAEANKIYSTIMDLEKSTGGLNASTIGTKLRDYGTGGQLRSGSSQAFSDINNLLPAESKFLGEAIELNNQRNVQNLLRQNVGESVLNDISRLDNAPYTTQDAVRNLAPEEVGLYQRLANQQKQQDEIMRTISGKAYERNPRLLANRNDLAGEQALDYLQSQSGINFMDELNDIRAREALEAWLPGQGGGSGSGQGAANLVRSALASSGITAAGTLQNPLIAYPFSLMLPKFGAKGTIQNLGRLNRLTEKEIPQGVQRLLPPVMAQNPLLYGQVEYNEGY